MENKVCKALCLKEKPKEYNKLFFGDYGNFQRIDYISHDVFRKLTEQSESNTWFMNEIDYSKDKKGHDLLSEIEKKLFHYGILYQNILDSLVPNTFATLSEISTDTYLSYLYSRINTEEFIHANTYSSGLTQVFGPNATEMLDHVYNDKHLQHRMDKDIIASRQLIQLAANGVVNDEFKKTLIVGLIRTIFLEGVRFPTSFYVTWTINVKNSNAIQGFSSALKLILWDELTVHLVTGLNVVRTLYGNREQGFYHLRVFIKETVYEIAKEVYESEMEWYNYLLENGEISLPGINIDIMEHFIKYHIDARIKGLRFDALYNEEKSDIIEWFDKYRDLNGIQASLQETDNLNYQKGSLKNDLQLLDNEH